MYSHVLIGNRMFAKSLIACFVIQFQNSNKKKTQENDLTHRGGSLKNRVQSFI